MSAPLDRIETGLVLVRDEEPQIHRFLSPALTVAGYTPLRAETGAAVLKLAAARAPDLVILDLELPDIDGHEVLARLRAFSSVLVIVLSARDRGAEKVAIPDYVADDYVTKRAGQISNEWPALQRVGLRHISSHQDARSDGRKAVSRIAPRGRGFPCHA
jgi:CheY-like chemotaxis protein